MKILFPNRKFGLQTKITASIVLFVLVTLGTIFASAYLNTIRVIKNDLNLRLINEVNIAVLQIDAEKHSQLKTVADEDTDSYKDIKSVLQKIRNNSTDIFYIYTLRENENSDISFIVDAEENPENVSHLADVYSDPNDFLKENFLKMNNPMVEDGFSTDKWGTWISAYAPFYDKYNKREGVLGIDIKASGIIAGQRKILLLYILFFALSGILSAILGMFLSKNLIKSLTSLTDILEKKDNSGELRVKQNGNDEIGELADAINKTLGEVDDSQKEAAESVIQKNRTLEIMNELMVGRELEMIKLKKEINELKKVKEL